MPEQPPTEQLGDPLHPPTGYNLHIDAGKIALLVPEHPSPEVRAINGCWQLLSALTPRAQERVLAYLADYCNEANGLQGSTSRIVRAPLPARHAPEDEF